MTKKERNKLMRLMRDLLSRVGTVTRYDEELLGIDAVLNSETLGRLTVTFHNARTNDRNPWLHCLLRDWPSDEGGIAVKQWQGLQHWKQNLIYNLPTSPEHFVELAIKHLQKLGVSINDSES